MANSRDDRLIALAKPLAAELTRLHQVDPNEIQKIMQHIITTKPEDNSREARLKHLRAVVQWLDALVDYADFFPRSEQTLSHTLAGRAVVEYLIEQERVANPMTIARILGWTVRLMRYYDQMRAEADSLIDRRRPRLDVPTARAVSLRYRPRQQPPTEQLSDVPDDSGGDYTPSDFAAKFMNHLNKEDDK